MRTAGVIGTSLILLFCSISCAHARTAEYCPTPSVQTLIAWYHTAYPDKPLRYSPRNSAIYHPFAVFRTQQPPIHWIGLAWLSPESGALFAVNCDGRPLAARSDGAIGKISAGPALPVLGQTVMAEYVDAETGDCVHDSIEILTLRDGNIVSLWKHGYRQGMNVTDAKTHFNGFVTENYAVSFSDDGKTIQVTGKILAYSYRKDGSQSPMPSSSKTLPAETWHWNASTLRFLPEKRYPQPGLCVNPDRSSAK